MKFKDSLKFVLLLSICALFLKLSNLPCPLRYLIGIPCPTCGMTRALLTLLSADIHSYFYYNACALPVFFSAIVLIFSKYLHKYFFYLATFILSLNTMYYIYRFSCHTIP